MQRLKASFLDQNSAGNGKIEHHIIKRLKQLTPAAAGLGFLYNNFLLDCNTMDSHHPHYLRPRNRPGSFVAPLFVMHNGRPWLAADSPAANEFSPVLLSSWSM
jgi:hypothetical protein